MLKNLSKVALLACAVGIGSGSSAQEVASGIIEFSPTEPYPVREVYYPGTEALAEDEMRVIACGTGMPTTRAFQAAACFLVELGNGDKFLFDCGSGSAERISPLKSSHPFPTFLALVGRRPCDACCHWTAVSI